MTGAINPVGVALSTATSAVWNPIRSPFSAWTTPAKELPTRLSRLDGEWTTITSKFKWINIDKIIKNICDRFWLGGFRDVTKPIKTFGNKNIYQVLATGGWKEFVSALPEAGMGARGWTFAIARTVGLPIIGLLGVKQFFGALKELKNQWNGYPTSHVRGKGIRLFMMATGAIMAVGGIGGVLCPFFAGMAALTPMLAGLAFGSWITSLAGHAYLEFKGGKNFLRYPEKLPPGFSDIVRKATKLDPTENGYWGT